MSWLVLRRKWRKWKGTSPAQQIFELGLSLLIGLLAGTLIVFSWGLPPKWQQLVVVIPIAFAFVLLTNNLERIVLASMAIGVPLNLDVSLMISPYGRSAETIARGGRTIIALTELRVSAVSIMLLIGYLLWIIETQSSARKPVRFFAATTIPALGLVFFSILSVFQAQDNQLALFRVVQLVELFLAYFYLANHIRTVEDLQFFLLVSIAGMLGESLVMIWQWITNSSFLIAGIQGTVAGPGRVAGTLDSTGPAGGYLSALGLIACAMAWASSRKHAKTFSVISFALGCVALVSTGSRISWIAFAATLPMLAMIVLQRGWVRVRNMVLLVVLVVITGAIFYDAIDTRFTAEDYGSAEARPMMWRLAWNMIKAHPWLGVGAGNHALMTRAYYTPDVGDPEYVLDIQVHNRYLLIWAESGTFAFLCYVGFLGASIVRAWSHVKSKNRWISLMGAALGCSIVSLCVQMLTATFLGRTYALFVWLMPALVAALSNIELSSAPQRTTDKPAVEAAASTRPAGQSSLLIASRGASRIEETGRVTA